MEEARIINESDNVATSLVSLEIGEVRLCVGKKFWCLRLKEPIPLGHKFSLQHIGKGDYIIKHGKIIGKASVPMTPGEHVHTHNVESLRGRGDLSLSQA